jgi:hypothetical protein
MKEYTVFSDAVLGLFVLIWGIYKAYFSFFKNKIKFPVKNKVDFFDHAFFGVMYNALNYTIPGIELKNDKHKEKITKIYATIKVEVFIEEISKVVKKFKERKGKHCFSEKQLLYIIDTTIKKYRKLAVKKISSEYNKKIATMFDDKFTNDIHMNCILTIISCISSICRSTFYKTCSEKLSAILDILTFAFQHTILDLEKTCNALNGELTKEFIKMGFSCEEYKEYITKEEYEMHEKVQNMQIKDLITKNKKL